MGEQGRGRARIVVGVDGSGGAQAALAWALDEAVRHDAEVEAVMTWHLPVVVASPYVGAYVDAGELEADTKQVLDAAVTEAMEGRGGVPVVRQVVVGGPAAATLLERAEGADLLVVGTRGHGGFTGLLLGSVSQQCVHHAPCPVVVVPS